MFWIQRIIFSCLLFWGIFSNINAQTQSQDSSLLKCIFLSAPIDSVPYWQSQGTINKTNEISSETRMLRIFVHFIRRDNGSGGVSVLNIETMLNHLRTAFEPHSICFSLMGYDEILSSYYYNLDLNDWDQLLDLL